MTSEEFVEKWRDKSPAKVDDGDADYLYWLASYYTAAPYIKELTRDFLSLNPASGCSFHRAMSLSYSWREQ